MKILLRSILLTLCVSVGHFVLACDRDPHLGTLVVAAGSFLAASSGGGTNWAPADTKGQMSFNWGTCQYEKEIQGLPPNTNYEWKVALNGRWGGDKGCNGGGNCQFNSGSTGAVLLIYNPFNSQLSANQLTSSQTSAPGASTSAPTCPDPYRGRIIRAAGDFQTDIGSTAAWSATEVNSVMKLDDSSCVYVLTLVGLKKDKAYEWKVTFDGSWSGSLGCGNGGNCKFTSSSAGTIELVFNPTSKQLSDRPVKTDCGNGQCEPGETCRSCENDCGACPPAVCGNNVCEDAESCSSCEKDCGKCPFCGDGKCEGDETYQNCLQDCPNELPGCAIFQEESCQSGSQSSANPGVDAKRWQTPKPGTKGYQESFQDYHTLVGYADIIYTGADRRSADVCIQARHRYSSTVSLTYIFDGEPQSNKCKRYSSSYNGILIAGVTGSDGSSLDLPEIDLVWNAAAIASRPGDYRNGQKGGVAEMFGWPHKDVMQECEFLAKAGYLGVKLFPVHEQLMSTQPFENAVNPWYFM